MKEMQLVKQHITKEFHTKSLLMMPLSNIM